jgi:hypothetical protein
MESVLLGDPFGFLAKWPAVLSRLPNLALCNRVSNEHRLLELNEETVTCDLCVPATLTSTEPCTLLQGKHNVLVVVVDGTLHSARGCA